MALKIPPPPYFAVEKLLPGFNRWLLEMTSILSNQGGIDPSEVTGLPQVITQVGTNTTNITALEGQTGGQGSAIAALQNEITVIDSEIATINGQITSLSSRAQLFNGVGAPNPGLGNVNDWYGNLTGAAGARVFIKTAVATWTAFPF